jgi:hypothetical protein
MAVRSGKAFEVRDGFGIPNDDVAHVVHSEEATLPGAMKHASPTWSRVGLSNTPVLNNVSPVMTVCRVA